MLLSEIKSEICRLYAEIRYKTDRVEDLLDEWEKTLKEEDRFDKSRQELMLDDVLDCLEDLKITMHGENRGA